MVVHEKITSEVMSGSNINDTNDPFVQYMNEIIDHVSLGVIFDVHRSIRLGTFHLDDIDNDTQKEFEIVDEVGVDVFGQQPMKKPIDCVCPNCQRNMAANRFAPHLEKCMGMGRNSSRIASRRIATSGKMEEFDIDDDYDNDWSYEFEKKGKKIKREKQILNSPRRGKAARRDAGGSRPSTPTSNASGDVSNNQKAGPTLQALEDLSQEEKIALLTQTCGARSEHTGKMCTRTGKCVQHTDEQRRAVRELLFGEGDDLPLPPFMKSEGSSLDQDDIHVDVDGYEDIDATPLLRDLNQMAWEEGSNISTGSDTTPSFQVVTKHSKKAKGRKTRSR